MDKRYEVRIWTMKDARTGQLLRGFGAYWPGQDHPYFTNPRREVVARWVSERNKRIAARAS